MMEEGPLDDRASGQPSSARQLRGHALWGHAQGVLSETEQLWEAYALLLEEAALLLVEAALVRREAHQLLDERHESR